jgi:hypothetical protein
MKRFKLSFILIGLMSFANAENFYNVFNKDEVIKFQQENKIENMTNLSKIFNVKYPFFEGYCINCYSTKIEPYLQYQYSTLNMQIFNYRYSNQLYSFGNKIAIDFQSNFKNVITDLYVSRLSKSNNNNTYLEITKNINILANIKSFYVRPYFTKGNFSNSGNYHIYGAEVKIPLIFNSSLYVNYLRNNYKVSNRKNSIKQSDLYLKKIFNFDTFSSYFKVGKILIKNNTNHQKYTPTFIAVRGDYQNTTVFFRVVAGENKFLILDNGKTIYDNNVYTYQVTIGGGLKISKINLSGYLYKDKLKRNNGNTKGAGINFSFSF